MVSINVEGLKKKCQIFFQIVNFEPVAFEIYLPEKRSTWQFGLVGFEIHFPESRIQLPWQAGKCEGNTLIYDQMIRHLIIIQLLQFDVSSHHTE